jgi:zinc protease
MKTVFRIGGMALALALAVPTARADQPLPAQAKERVAPAAPRPARPLKPKSPPAPTAAPPTPPPTPAPPLPPAIAIPFEKYTLANGLTVILSERRDLPMVVVDVIVKVGSRFEAKGRTGFAHLFEHLMFMGTNRVPTGAFDQWMEAEGAANNAWTSEDRTNYFSFGPAHALPLLLWLEADRLTSLGDSMTQERLEAQRGVVRNERRQTSENEPYGKAELLLPELLYPEGHPYHHPVIGSHEDLEAATVADVKTFFASHYVPANMALVVAGDFDPAETKRTIEKWFGLLGAAPGGDESTRAAVVVPEASAIPHLGRVVRKTVSENNIQLPKIIVSWHSPPRFAPGDAELDLLSNVLVRGKTSRLHQVLVFEKELAQSVTASQSSQDLSSVFTIEAVARPGVTLDVLEAEIDKVLTGLLDKGPTAKEIERAKIDFETSFVLGLESLPSRASSLALYQSFAGDPGFIGKDLARYRAVDVAAAHAAAKRTFDLGSRVILRIEPEKAPAANPPAGSKGGAP